MNTSKKVLQVENLVRFRNKQETHFHLSKFDLLCTVYRGWGNQDRLGSEPEIMK